jgi:soluble lytic murein transglycosylase-like protein
MSNLFTNLISRISLVELFEALSSISSRKNVRVNAETGNRIVSGDKDKKTFAEIIREASARYGVDESVIRAVIKQESSFNPEAVSRCGAQGLMQLMPATAQSLGVKDAFNPEENIMAGTRYLKQKLDEFDGNLALALAAYNAGSGAVRKYGGIPPYQETQSYVNKVIKSIDYMA